MAINFDAYEHGHVKDVHSLISVTENRDVFQGIWERLWKKSRITTDELYDLDLELPAATRRIISEAIVLYTDNPKDRDPELRSWFKGRILPFRPIIESAAHALATAAGSEFTLTERERVFSKKDGFPDPIGAASLFFRLIAMRVAKKKPRETARMIGTAGPRRSGLGRR